MARFPTIRVDDFRRAFDELIDELLVDRWRRIAAPDQAEGGEVLEYSDRYEVRIESVAEPRDLEVEVTERQLVVMVQRREEAGGQRKTFRFARAINREAVTARWMGGRLVIRLPKALSRRVRVEPE